MAIKNLTKKLDDITKLPRPSRREVSKILQEVYKQGIQHSDNKVSKKVGIMYEKYLKLKGKYLH
jgi:phage-related protein